MGNEGIMRGLALCLIAALVACQALAVDESSLESEVEMLLDDAGANDSVAMVDVASGEGLQRRGVKKKAKKVAKKHAKKHAKKTAKKHAKKVAKKHAKKKAKKVAKKAVKKMLKKKLGKKSSKKKTKKLRK